MLLLAVFEHGIESPQILLFPHRSILTLTNEKIVEFSILVIVVKDTFGFLLVSPGTPALLHIPLQTLGH